MRRRRFLAAAAACLAGCTTDRAGVPGTPTGLSDPGGDPSGEPATPPDETPESINATVAVDALGVPPEQSDCPVERDAARVICSSEVDPAETPLSLDAAPTEGSLPAATFTFTLTNGTPEAFETNFHDWAVWKRGDQRWHHIAPRFVIQPLYTLEPGDSHTWHLSIDDVRSDDRPGTPTDTEGISLTDVGGGEYAFTTNGSFEGDSNERQLGLAARFRLSGGTVELAPTDDVTETIRDGDAVVVHTDVRSENGRPAAFVLERTTEEPDRQMITEQAMRDPRFRNTLPFFAEGVDIVRLEEQNSRIPPFGVQEPYVVAYGGEAFRVSAEEL